MPILVAVLCSCGVVDTPYLETGEYALYIDKHSPLVGSCLSKNIDRYTKTLIPGFQPKHQIHIVVTDRLSKALGTWTPAHTIVINESSRHMAVFGHEYIRVYCYETKRCNPYHPSTDWSGHIGEMWNKAEDLARRICG